MKWILLVCLLSVDEECVLPVKEVHADVITCMSRASDIATRLYTSNIISASLCYPEFEKL